MIASINRFFKSLDFLKGVVLAVAMLIPVFLSFSYIKKVYGNEFQSTFANIIFYCALPLFYQLFLTIKPEIINIWTGRDLSLQFSTQKKLLHFHPANIRFINIYVWNFTRFNFHDVFVKNNKIGHFPNFNASFFMFFKISIGCPNGHSF